MQYIIAILILLITNVSFSEDKNDIILYQHVSSSSDGTTRTSYSIPASVVRKQEKWSPSTNANPPLSINKAVKLAKQSIFKKNPELSELEPLTIEMEKIKTNEVWYYIISFGKIENNGMKKYGKLFGPKTMAVILMDGAVVKPSIKKESNN